MGCSDCRSRAIRCRTKKPRRAVLASRDDVSAQLVPAHQTSQSNLKASGQRAPRAALINAFAVPYLCAMLRIVTTVSLAVEIACGRRWHGNTDRVLLDRIEGDLDRVADGGGVDRCENFYTRTDPIDALAARLAVDPNFPNPCKPRSESFPPTRALALPQLGALKTGASRSRECQN
jgi:hypothetical protein